MPARLLRLCCLLLLVLPLTAESCGKKERMAQALFEKGKRLEKAKQYPQAIEIYKKIQEKYPESEAAKQVKQSVDFTLIEQAMAIDRLKNVNDVKDHLKGIAKAVEGFYFKESRYPASLDELVPSYMPAVPRDPWGARYIYGVTNASHAIIDAADPTAAGYMVAWFGRDRIPGGDGDDTDVFIRSGQFLEF